MAFCRWGPESDVYMYYSSGAYNCSNCILAPHHVLSTRIVDAEDAAEHLRQHRDAGHKVPPGTVAAVLADGG